MNLEQDLFKNLLIWVTARFELTERTLFELLYDEVDDWLNPGTLKPEQVASM